MCLDTLYKVMPSAQLYNSHKDVHDISVFAARECGVKLAVSERISGNVDDGLV